MQMMQIASGWDWFFVFLMKRLLPFGSRNILRSTVSSTQINALFVS